MPVAVLDLAAAGVPTELAANLTAIVAAEVSRYDDLRPITRREIVSLIDHDRERQLLGCTEESCLAPVADALGVRKLISGQIGRVEESWVLTLYLVDARSAKVDARSFRTAPATGNHLVDAARSAVTDLLGERASSKNGLPRLAVARSLGAQRFERVELDASRCYDTDGDPLRIRWRQVDGPPALLEDPLAPVASFRPAEVGVYRFAVQVTDGRSPPQEQEVSVEVTERRRFQLALGYHQLLSFNRLVKKDVDGNVFRNRAPLGPKAVMGLKLSDRWKLTGGVLASYMHVYPEDASLEANESLDVWELNVRVGADYRFPFDGFDIWLGGEVGTSRLFMSALWNGRKDDLVRTQTVDGTAHGAFDIALTDWLGLLVQAGLRVRVGTDEVAPFNGVGFRVERDAFLWGVDAFAGPYVRF